MRDDDDAPEMPSGRLLLIMERHEAMKERKRLGIKDVPTQVHPALAPKPALALSPLAAPDDHHTKLHGSEGGKTGLKHKRRCMYDFPAAIRHLGRPTQKEIAAHLGCSIAGVSLWFSRTGHKIGFGAGYRSDGKLIYFAKPTSGDQKAGDSAQSPS